MADQRRPDALSHPRRLPPLNATRVFATVVRHGSFRAAAEVLRVSPQAVSQQIKGLEDMLGVALFLRKGRTVEPTEAGKTFAHHVDAAMEELAEGVRRVTGPLARQRINVNASPYFATRFLLDRLGDLRMKMPGADLRLTTIVDLPDFVSDDVDVAIQWGFGNWKPFEAQLLLPDYKEICCSPDLAKALHGPEDLLNTPLLHPVLGGDLWRNVLGHLGVQHPDMTQDLQFADAATMRRAAGAGLGVGLLSVVDAEEDLQSGRLVAPFGRGVMLTMPPDQIPGFYLVVPRSHRRVRAIAAFCDWVQTQTWDLPDRGTT